MAGKIYFRSHNITCNHAHCAAPVFNDDKTQKIRETRETMKGMTRIKSISDLIVSSKQSPIVLKNNYRNLMRRKKREKKHPNIKMEFCHNEKCLVKKFIYKQEYYLFHCACVRLSFNFIEEEK